MTTRARPAGRFCRASSALVVLAVLTTVLFAAGNAAASSPAPSEKASRAYAVLSYPNQQEAFNTPDGQGWVNVPGEAPGGQEGPVLCSYSNIETYRFVDPKTATTAAKTAVNWKWILLGIGGAVFLLAVMWLLQRRIQRKGDE
jgi:hypothetical protein